MSSIVIKKIKECENLHADEKKYKEEQKILKVSLFNADSIIEPANEFTKPLMGINPYLSNYYNVCKSAGYSIADLQIDLQRSCVTHYDGSTKKLYKFCKEALSGMFSHPDYDVTFDHNKSYLDQIVFWFGSKTVRNAAVYFGSLLCIPVLLNYSSIWIVCCQDYRLHNRNWGIWYFEDFRYSNTLYFEKYVVSLLTHNKFVLRTKGTNVVYIDDVKECLQKNFLCKNIEEEHEDDLYSMTMPINSLSRFPLPIEAYRFNDDDTVIVKVYLIAKQELINLIEARGNQDQCILCDDTPINGLQEPKYQYATITKLCDDCHRRIQKIGLYKYDPNEDVYYKELIQYTKQNPVMELDSIFHANIIDSDNEDKTTKKRKNTSSGYHASKQVRLDNEELFTID